MKRIKIGDRYVGEGYPTFIVAEIGYNFNTLEEAIKSVDAAKECGVDAVKFQTFKAKNVVIKSLDFPPEAGGGSQFDEFKRYELSDEWHRRLFSHAENLDLPVFSTPSHFSDLPLLESLDVQVYKVGSDDLTNIPFLVEIAKLRKPMIVSTGMSTLSEVVEAVEAIHAAGNNDIVLMHALSNYPIRNLEYVNLKAIETMGNALDVLVGYSDHTTTLSAPIAAVALGARVYEKHFTIDKNLATPDAALSAGPNEMAQIVKSIRETELMLGDGIKKPAPSEEDMRLNTRKSIVSIKKIAPGEKLSLNNLAIKRPGRGIPPKFIETLVGKKVRIPIPADTVITWDMLL